MKAQKVYHMGIPVDDLDRAREFYTQTLGMEYLGRRGGDPAPGFKRSRNRGIGAGTD